MAELQNESGLNAEELLSALKWRYATKQFDSLRKISDKDWAALEQALLLTPSSYGLQPWKFLVIRDPALRAQLMPVSWNQKQVLDCSHHIVFAAKTDITLGDVNQWIQRLAEVRGVTPESLAVYKSWMVKDLVEGPRHQVIHEWAARQCYIALGNFMTAAALLGIDTCPMEGLEPGKYDEILGLPAAGYKTVVACSAGYRALTDKYAAAAKVRYPAADIIEHR
ncbi:MAG: NAD(P)H-dependent oxidoreductase [Omnitrophica bacterium GWA2_52_12]|nr:MAG: NAD(P)H-dependent oxidoreductase [Omnitrophica bacterium GWA2_52_12]